MQDREVEIGEGEASLGRSQSANVSVKDASVSRNHAQILARAGHLTVKDLNSSNGTFVNGMRIFAEAEIHDGDTLTLGESEMRVRILPPESVAATMRIDPRALLAGEELRLQAEEEAKAALTPGAARPRAPLPPPPSALSPVPRPASPPGLRSAAPMSPPQFPAPPQLDPASPATGPTPLPSRPAAGAGPPPAAVLPAALAAVLPVELPLRAAVVEPPAALREPLADGADAFAFRDLDLPPLPPVEDVPKPIAPRPPLPGVAPALAVQTTPAGFWVRLVAVLIDALLLALVCGGLFFATSSVLDEPQRVQLIGAVWFGLDLVMRFVGWSVWGATPGKALLGLRVFPTGSTVPGIGFGKGLLRCIGYGVSGAVLGIGFLLVAFTADKRGLHDMIAGTTVGKIARAA